MNEDLFNLIRLFNKAQENALIILENFFSCSRPVSRMDYISRCVPIIREANYEASGHKIRPHGYGMEINVGDITIDFDFGENGEINGFDAWRLENFVKENNLKTPLDTKEKLETAINIAIKGEYIYQAPDSNLYIKT